MLNRPLKACAAASILAACGGCASFGTFESARTIGPEKTQVQVRPQLVGAVVEGARPIFKTQVDLVIRHGVWEGLEVNLKAGPSGMALGAKQSLLQDRKKAVALAASFGGMYAGVPFLATASMSELAIPCIIGLSPREGTEFLLAPKLIVRHATLRTAGGKLGAWAGIGALSLGLNQKISRTFFVRPEVSIAHPFLYQGDNLDDNAISYTVRGFMFNAGIGLDFGGG